MALCSRDCCEAFFALCDMPMTSKTPEVGNAAWHRHRFFLESALDDGCTRFDNRNGSDGSSSVVFDRASNAPWRKLYSGGDGHVNMCLWSELGGVQLGFRVGNEIGASSTARLH